MVMVTPENPINLSKVESEHGVLSSDDITCLKNKLGIQARVRLRIPSAEDRTCYPKPGEVCLFATAFAAGLRLPSHPFIRSLLEHFHLAPSQLVPNAWRHIVGAIIL